MVTLFCISKIKKPTSNGFRRNLKQNTVTLTSALNLGYNSFYLAGVDKESIYLCNSTSSNLILKVNPETADTFHIWLRIPGHFQLNTNATRVYIHPPLVCFMDGVTPQIFATEINATDSRLIPIDSTYFSIGLPVSRNSFVLRVFDNAKSQFVLTKIGRQQPYDPNKDGILEKQEEGRFSVDGMLKHDPKSNRLIYMYYYRNEFIVMDTSLNIQYKGHTIDTTSKAHIKVAKLNRTLGSQYILASPPFEVNNDACLDGKYIYIHSNLRADNDDKNIFKNSATIDVYHSEFGQYRSSFYLQKYKNQNLFDMMTSGNRLFVIFGQYLCIYKINKATLAADD